MKRIFVLAVFAISMVLGFNPSMVAQNNGYVDGRIYAKSIAPQYPDGDEAMVDFVKSAIVYPKKALEAKACGIVYVNVTINNKGKVTKAVVKKSPNELLDKEAMRVAKLLVFNPAMSDKGKPLGGMRTIPIEFVLPE